MILLPQLRAILQPSIAISRQQRQTQRDAKLSLCLFESGDAAAVLQAGAWRIFLGFMLNTESKACTQRERDEIRIRKSVTGGGGTGRASFTSFFASPCLHLIPIKTYFML